MVIKKIGSCYRVLMAGLLLCLLTGAVGASEVILTADDLNTTLKEMQRLKQKMDTDTAARPDALFQTGILARDLAATLSEEVALYDAQQGGLIQLALDRTAELGVQIDWVGEKKRFLYDSAAFREYLQLAPSGPHAAESAYEMLETEFVGINPENPAALQKAAQHKLDYLQQYADAKKAAEVALLLAIDYRDIWRLYKAAADAANEKQYREMTLAQFRKVSETYAGARQAKIAAGLQSRFEAELQNGDNPEAGQAQ